MCLELVFHSRKHGLVFAQIDGLHVCCTIVTVVLSCCALLKVCVCVFSTQKCFQQFCNAGYCSLLHSYRILIFFVTSSMAILYTYVMIYVSNTHTHACMQCTHTLHTHTLHTHTLHTHTHIFYCCTLYW